MCIRDRLMNTLWKRSNEFTQHFCFSVSVSVNECHCFIQPLRSMHANALTTKWISFNQHSRQRPSATWRKTTLKFQQFKMTHQRKATKKHAQPTLFKPFTSLRITYTIHSILRLYKHNTHCLRMASSYVSECHVNRSILFCLKLQTRAHCKTWKNHTFEATHRRLWRYHTPSTTLVFLWNYPYIWK